MMRKLTAVFTAFAVLVIFAGGHLWHSHASCAASEHSHHSSEIPSVEQNNSHADTISSAFCPVCQIQQSRILIADKFNVQSDFSMKIADLELTSESRELPGLYSAIAPRGPPANHQ